MTLTKEDYHRIGREHYSEGGGKVPAANTWQHKAFMEGYNEARDAYKQSMIADQAVREHIHCLRREINSSKIMPMKRHQRIAKKINTLLEYYFGKAVQ